MDPSVTFGPAGALLGTMHSRSRLRLLPPLLGWALTAGCATAPPHAPSPEPLVPKYLPSAYSDASVDILTDAYGAFGGAPEAPGLGATIEDFTLPLAGGDVFKMADARAKGDVVVVFFRGFW